MIFPSILPPITEDLSTYQTSCWHQEFFFFPPFLSVWTFALEVSSFFGSGPWNALMMFRFQLHWPSPKERWNSKSITNIPKSVKIQHFFFNLNAFIGCEFCNYTIKSSAGRIYHLRENILFMLLTVWNIFLMDSLTPQVFFWWNVFGIPGQDICGFTGS